MHQFDNVAIEAQGMVRQATAQLAPKAETALKGVGLGESRRLCRREFEQARRSVGIPTA